MTLRGLWRRTRLQRVDYFAISPGLAGQGRLLSGGGAARDSTLWEGVYDFIRSHDVVTRKEVLHHFRLDDEDLVRGVVHDLTENGFVFKPCNALSVGIHFTAKQANLGDVYDLPEVMPRCTDAVEPSNDCCETLVNLRTPEGVGPRHRAMPECSRERQSIH